MVNDVSGDVDKVGIANNVSGIVDKVNIVNDVIGIVDKVNIVNDVSGCCALNGTISSVITEPVAKASRNTVGSVGKDTRKK